MRRNRDEILAAAASYLGREGVRIPSTTELAEILDISRSSLYYHFPEKGDLLSSILIKSGETFCVAARQIVEYPLPAPDRLRLLLRAILPLLLETPTTSIMTIWKGERGILSPEQRQLYIEQRDEYEGYFRQLIAQGIEHQEFRPVNVKLTTFAILGMLEVFDGWYDPDGEFTVDQVADSYADFIAASLSADNSPGPLVGDADASTLRRRTPS